MLKKVICGLIALGSFGFSLLGAGDAFAGTWKINVANSKFPKGRELKDMTLVVTIEGDIGTVTQNPPNTGCQPPAALSATLEAFLLRG